MSDRTQTSSVRSSARVRPRDRRDQIVAAAARLFAEYGFETTSVRQIADAVNMLPGSLYHHFATKEDILHAVLREPLQEMTEKREFLHGEGDPEQRLIASVVTRFQDAVAKWEVHTILMNDAAFFRRNPDFAYVLSLKSESFRLQEAIIAEGIAARLCRRDIDVYLMIGTIARMLNSAADWFRSGDYFSSGAPDEVTLERIVRFHIDCVLRLVREPGRLECPIALDSLPGKP